MQIEFPVIANINSTTIKPGTSLAVCTISEPSGQTPIHVLGSNHPDAIQRARAIAETLNVLEQAACLLREGITITAGGAVASRIKAAASMLKGEPI